MDNSNILLELAKLSEKGSLDASTLSLSRKLGISQQSVSRKLIEMERQRLVRRVVNQKGLTIMIDSKGKELLAEKYSALKQFFKDAKSMISGVLKTGLGEGKYYMSQPEYIAQFVEKLGFKPYPGTLNLTVDEIKALTFVNSLKPLRINGFERQERSFGALTSYRVKVKDITAAVIIPDRTMHDRTTLEVISPYYLRDELKIKDGDTINVEGV